MISLIHNCRLLTPGEDVCLGSIGIDEVGVISTVSEGDTEGEHGSSYDAQGLYAAPGFIDIHTHGVNGCDLTDATLESVRKISETKLREGVTTYLPTSLTLPPENLKEMAGAVAEYRKNEEFARTPSLHIEGPYINPNCLGAQNGEYVRLPDADEVLALNEIAPIGVVSLAVEMEGAVDFIAEMKRQGITTSCAHSAATYAQFSTARDAGLAHLTHYCNQMTPLHHREVGLVGAGLLDLEVMTEMICDTIHLCPDMIRIAFKHRPIEAIMLVTDSMAASWLGDGEYEIGGLQVQVKAGQARLASGALAGSTLRYNEGLKNIAEITSLPLNQLIATTAANQARSLGFADRGRLQVGLLADVVLLNDDFEVKAVFVGGEQKI
ncbi:MAG: N-acetylglucosamine-6-phosphate deacetylase [Verrucomicrobiales bacterium]|nr:N-acetylglucosamine-6-phosphate deacetylase [Verrucomicrobiales bacterium]